ncbi:SO_0444 family Cu/Zn efflux transporter [Alteromonas sp. CYL-A6]|uniref:SO_0444 family Cu/Zn efflux transporter n=1 Tax=Alteromonas nitratireducens TaxID=3390813 RepID=UPI0034A7D672
MADLLLLVENFFSLFMESAPWLLLGLLIAGIMHELVPVDLLKKHMGNDSVSAITKSAVIGAPLPLCSCGVIPAAVGLRRSGASRPATMSFLVSTPETGVDSVSVTYALLGPVFAVFRPIAAVLSAIYTGLLVRWFAERDAPAQSAAPAEKSCCSSKAEPVKDSSCCDSEPAKNEASCCGADVAPATPSAPARIWAFATGKLLNDIALWLLLGLLLAACITTWVPTDFLTQWGDGLIAMLVMALIGVPMYICATASTPLAVGFLAAGLSPGAVLVFLMAGPATNISTMGMIMQEMGRRTLVLYLFGVISASIICGYALNAVVSAWALDSMVAGAAQAHLHTGQYEVIYALCAVILGGLMIINGWQALLARRARTTTSECCH